MKIQHRYCKRIQELLSRQMTCCNEFLGKNPTTMARFLKNGGMGGYNGRKQIWMDWVIWGIGVHNVKFTQKNNKN